MSHSRRPSPPPIRILICATHETDRFLLQAMLEHGGHDVTATDSGTAFLDALEAPFPHRYDLAFLDLELTDLDARDVYLAHQYASAGTPKTPMIAFGSYCPDNCQQEWVDLGISAVLIKPLTLESIFHAILPIVAQAQLDEESVGNSAQRYSDVPPLEVQLMTPIIDQLAIREALEKLPKPDRSFFADQVLRRFHEAINNEMNALSNALDNQSPYMVRYHLRNIVEYAKEVGLLRLAQHAENQHILDPEEWFEHHEHTKAEMRTLMAISITALANTLETVKPRDVMYTLYE